MTMDRLRTIMAASEELITLTDDYQSHKIFDAAYVMGVKEIALKMKAAKATEENIS